MSGDGKLRSTLPLAHSADGEQPQPCCGWSFSNVTTAVTVPNFSGGFVGAGAKPRGRLVRVPSISIRGEYRYTSFGSGQLGLPTVDGINLNDFVSARASPTMQDGRVSLNYRF